MIEKLEVQNEANEHHEEDTNSAKKYLLTIHPNEKTA